MKRARKLCFLGDSLIEYFDWAERFPEDLVLNLGVAGETASELMARLSSFGPKLREADAVILMTGTNDLLMGVDFLASYESIIVSLQEMRPNAVCLVNGIMPMTLPWLTSKFILQANVRVEELALRYKIGYLDGCRFLSDPAVRCFCFLDDGVHLSSHGYALWSAAIENYLDSCCGCLSPSLTDE